MVLLYSILYLVGICLYVPRALWRRRSAAAIRQRLGRVPDELFDCRGALWIHAVSVGEVHAARALLPPLRARFPGVPVVLSTTTDTGQALAAEAGADATFYMPLDLAAALRPFLRALEPRGVLLVETEIWPRLLHECDRAGIPVLLVNARLSPRSFRGYRWLARCWPAPLRGLAGVCARTRTEAERFRALGIAASKVWVTGNLKGEAATLTPPPDQTERLRVHFGLASEPVLVAGCTMAGEEAAVLDAFERAREAIPELRLLLAPRHPERFAEVAEAVRVRELSLRRRSDTGGPPGEPPAVLLLDTIGELPAAYGLGAVSFVGGSLVATGGHNLLEPAVQGQPVIYGPHTHNFADLAAAFDDAGAGLRVTDAGALADAVVRLCRDPGRRARLGARARALASRDAGAAARTVRRISAALEESR